MVLGESQVFLVFNFCAWTAMGKRIAGIVLWASDPL